MHTYTHTHTKTNIKAHKKPEGNHFASLIYFVIKSGFWKSFKTMLTLE